MNCDPGCDLAAAYYCRFNYSTTRSGLRNQLHLSYCRRHTLNLLMWNRAVAGISTPEARWHR